MGIRIYAIILFFLIPQTVWSQKIQNINGSYRYVVPENVTIETAKITAIERAKIEALADAFGTVVSQNNSMIIENVNQKSNVLFLSLGSSDVNGEWLSDTKEPTIETILGDGSLVVSAHVVGKARRIVTSSIDIAAKLLRNGIEEKSENETFKNGDNLYLLFESPVNGYLTAYLADNSQQVYCLLPYQSSTKGSIAITGGKKYIFFDERNHTNQEEIVDQYQLTCEESDEYNRIYILFSPNEFSKANDKSSENEALPRSLSFENFQKWLTKCRVRDTKMQVTHKIILIKK